MARQKRNLLTLGAIGFALLLFVILGIFQTEKSHKTIVVAQDGQGSGTPAIGGAFELTDAHGKVWKNTDFKGKSLLVYFGYSYCPHICPQALTHMTQALEELGGSQVIQPVFVSVDPERDTLDSLKNFAQNFHKDFIMLTGSKEKIQEALKSYRVYAAKASENARGNDYQVDHSSLIYLMDKNGGYVAHFDHETPSDDIVKRVKLYLENGK
jgi:cytochrome oxidase Cu insertion factor (SCO1/SenC/PrrC family)